MLSPARRQNLDRLLKPRRIAYVGGDAAAHALNSSDLIGFAGEVWAVNPGRPALGRHRCYGSLAELPGVPDAAFVAVSRERSVEVVAELAALGAGGAVCYAAGYKEMGPEGAALQTRLAAAAGEMALVGPNCYGMLNYLDGAALWADVHGGTRVARGVAVVSQSGNIALNLTMTGRSVPLAQVISVGNQAVLQIGDYIEALADDPRITAIGLYLEGLEDVAAFSRAAEHALAKGKPLVALKVGRSEVAARLALSHTSSLAGRDEVYDALFERLGILRVESLSGFMETLKLLSFGGPLPGRRLGVLTCSGGDAALTADLAQQQGLSVPALSDRQVAAMKPLFGSFTTVANPMDYNTEIWGRRDALETCFAALMSEGVDATLLIIDYAHAGLPGLEAWDTALEALIAAAESSGGRAFPVASFPELLPAQVRERAIAAGLVPLQGLEDAIVALAAGARYGEIQSAKREAAAAGKLRLPESDPAPAGSAGLDEWASKQRLAAAGLRVPRGRKVAAAAAETAAREIGFPVVVKAVNASLVHKSDAGAVALNLRDAGAVTEALQAMADLAENFIVEEMVPGALAELIVGIKREPGFGLALVIGSGGELVELVQDSAVLLLPTDRTAVEAALEGLKAARLLAGFRGRPPGERAAAVEAILAIAAFAEDERDRLLELDVNPLLILPDGQGAVAADAYIRLATSERET